MTPGTNITIISPLIGLDGKNVLTAKGKQVFTARRGIFGGTKDGYRTALVQGGHELHLPLGQGHRLTTKPVDISPCGLLE